MAYARLSDFIQRLEQAGELIRIKAPVSAELEITEITDRISRLPVHQNKALLFENVEGSRFPLVINLYGGPRRMAWAMGVDDLEELNDRLAKLIDLKLPKGLRPMLRRGLDVFDALRRVGLGPSRASTAPVQEVVVTDHPDVNILPILKCWPHDGGKYITLTSVITRDPNTGTRNVGMYRVQVYDGQTLGLHWQRHKGGKEHQEAGKERHQQKIPVAIVLGGDPAAMWCGSAPLPPGIDEFLLANWLRGKPTPFVKCLTQDLEVPANAEFVIEGWFDPNEHRLEGPFGDHTGFYTPPDLFPVMHVTAVTHRRDAIYPTTIVGKPPQEDLWLGKATERLFLPLMKLFMGEIVDYAMPAEGVFHNLVIVSIRKRFPGHAQKIMYGLWGLGLMMLTKGFIIVDAEVDVHDIQAVAREVVNNVDWHYDVTIVDGPVDQLDHSAIEDSYGGKIGLDATRSTRPEFSQPFPPLVPLPTEQITALVGDRWHETHGALIVALDKGRLAPKEALRRLWELCPDRSLILVDAFVDPRDLSDVAWRALGNTDWRRDIDVLGGVDHFAPAGNPRGQIGIDATIKTAADGHPRGWPEEIAMSPEIIERVTRRWQEYGLS